MSDHDDKQRLLDAAQAAVADAREKAETRAREGRSTATSRGIMFGASLALFGVAIYLAAVRPPWFLTPPPAPEPPVIQDASARLTLVREVQRIEAWRAANGRLPADLAEAGVPVAGLRYERISDSAFAVSLPVGADLLTLHSTDSVGTFLGNAVGTVVARVRQ